MDEKQVLFLLIIIFLATQSLGLYVAMQYSTAIDEGILEPAVENPADPVNSLLLFAYILTATAIILIVIRFRKEILRVLEAVAVFFASLIVFDFLFPYLIGGVIPVSLLLALSLTLIKAFHATYLTQNVAMMFAVAGAGSILGVSLEIIPVVVFMTALAAYDVVAVFFTKHMVYMAKAITERPYAFTAAIPATFSRPRKVHGRKKKVKGHVFQLGGGDLVLPLMFSASVLRYASLDLAISSLAGALIGLILLFLIVLKKPGRALPALPAVCLGSLAGFGIGALVF